MNLSSILLFFNRNKTNILLAALCVLLAWLIINWFRYLNNNYFIFKGTNNINQKEGFKPNIEPSNLVYSNSVVVSPSASTTS